MLVVTRRSGRNALVRVAITAAIMAYLLNQVAASEVLAELRSAAPQWIAMAALVAFAGQWLVAERLRRLVEALGPRASTLELLQIDLAARFYGLFLPGGNLAGVLARFYQIARRDGAYAATAVALAIERLVATLTLCFVGILFWLLELPTGNGLALVVMLGAFAGLLAVQALLFLERPLTVRMRARAARWWPRQLASLRDALSRSRGLPRALLVEVLLLGVVVNLIGIVTFGLVALALDLQLSLLTIAWTRSAAVLVTVRAGQRRRARPARGRVRAPARALRGRDRRCLELLAARIRRDGPGVRPGRRRDRGVPSAALSPSDQQRRCPDRSDLAVVTVIASRRRRTSPDEQPSEQPHLGLAGAAAGAAGRRSMPPRHAGERPADPLGVEALRVELVADPLGHFRMLLVARVRQHLEEP